MIADADIKFLNSTVGAVYEMLLYDDGQSRDYYICKIENFYSASYCYIDNKGLSHLLENPNDVERRLDEQL